MSVPTDVAYSITLDDEPSNSTDDSYNPKGATSAREVRMNFLCDKCKQKYHVADEKVRGRAVARFKCKKCDHVIEVRVPGADTTGAPAGPIEDLSGAGMIPSSVPPPATPRSTAPAATTPRPATNTSLPTAATAPRPATSTSLPTASTRSTTSGALPPRPVTGPRPSTAVASVSRPAPSAPRPVTSTALPAAATKPAAPRPATSPVTAAVPRPTATASPSALRSGLASASEGPVRTSSSVSLLLNASETGWYAGVRNVPVGPLTRTELAAKIESGDITPDSLVWREGMDDWRPLRDVEELKDLLRQAAEKMSDGLLGTMGRKPSHPPDHNVVPIGQARPTSKPATHEPTPDSGTDTATAEDEPTRITTLAELIAQRESVNRAATLAPAKTPAATHAPATTSSQPSETASTEKTAGSTSAPAVAPASTASPLAPSEPARAPVTVISPAAIAGPNDPTVNVDPVAPAPFTMRALTPSATATVADETEVPQRQTRRQGLPPGVYVMMAGVAAAGIAVGIFLRPSAPPPPAPAAATTPARTAATPVDPPVGRTVGAEIRLPVEEPPPPPSPSAPPPAPVVTAHAPTPTRSNNTGQRSGNGTSNGSSGGGSSRTLTAAQLAMLNTQLGGAPGGITPSSTGPTTTTLRNASQESGSGGLSGSARAGQVIETLQRSGAVGSCWNSATRRNPAHPPESIRVQLDVSSSGRATAVRVMGANDPELANCIQTRARSQFFGAGGSVTAEVSFNLTPGH